MATKSISPPRDGSQRRARRTSSSSTPRTGSALEKTDEKASPKLTLLTEFTQIVRYQRTKPSRRRSFCNPQDAALAQQARETRKKERKKQMRKSLMEDNTFARNVGYLQEQSEEFTRESAFAKKVDSTHSSIQSATEELAKSIENSTYVRNLTYIQAHSEELSSNLGESMKMKDTSFAKGVDDLQAAAEEWANYLGNSIYARNISMLLGGSAPKSSEEGEEEEGGSKKACQQGK